MKFYFSYLAVKAWKWTLVTQTPIVSRLTLIRLCTIIWLGSCNDYSLVAPIYL